MNKCKLWSGLSLQFTGKEGLTEELNGCSNESKYRPKRTTNRWLLPWCVYTIFFLFNERAGLLFFFDFHFKKEDIFFKNVRNLRLQSQGNLSSVRRKKTFSTNILETKHGQLSIPTLNAPNDVISADVGLFAYVTTSRCRWYTLGIVSYA